jgi:hypothetical protein
MENPRFQIESPQTTWYTSLTSEQGFALVSLIALVPLLAALFIALSAGLYFMKRKSLAQAHCVQQAAQLQTELKDTLDKLLRLNPKAKSLRTQRDLADKALQKAVASGNPYAIGAAKAYWTAVFLQQLALRSKQQALLARADQQRHSGHRQLRDRLRSLRVSAVNSRKYYWRSLAVEAFPLKSLTPNYEPLPLFSQFQQHRFRFEVDLRPKFASVLKGIDLRQITECSVTLKGEKRKWELQIVAANPPSKRLWF